MASKSIPIEVKQAVEQIVDQFNRKELARQGIFYIARYRGQHVYLDRDDGGGPGPIFRLTYNGDMKRWKFAIYKYSSDEYDPDEWWFPGADLVDGTVEGALKAGMNAYE